MNLKTKNVLDYVINNIHPKWMLLLLCTLLPASLVVKTYFLISQRHF